MKLYAALLLLSLAVGGATAELAFTKSLHSRKPAPAASAVKGNTKIATSAPALYGYGEEKKPADVKHLCLKESKQYNCRYVGCPNVVDCGATASGIACYDCQTHIIGQ